MEAEQAGQELGALDVEVEQTDGPNGALSLVVCRGEIDMATAPLLRDTLREITDSDVIIDLCATTFVDSTGLSTLLNALRRVTRAGRRLAVACPPSAVRNTIRLTDLVETLRVADDRRSAVALLAR